MKIVASTYQLLKQRIQYLTLGNYHGVSPNYLEKNGSQLFTTTASLFDSFTQLGNFDADLFNEGLKLYQQFDKRLSDRNYPSRFNCGSELAGFLYLHLHNYRPKVIVETGVANGITTNIIMAVLESTEGAILHSFDINPDTKNVYNGPGSWEFHHLAGDFKSDLSEKVKDIGEVDLWLHDSNHGFSWQSFEYKLAHEKLKSGGLLVSDDIDASTAWSTVVPHVFQNLSGVFDNRKFFGVAVKE